MNLITNQNEGFIHFEISAHDLKGDVENHLALIRFLLSQSDSALFVSPFLFEDFSPLFEGLNLQNIEIELITTCAPKGDDQFRKPYSLRDFGVKAKAIAGKWPAIGIDQALHSKVYVFFKERMPFAGIVTSANLTFSGLAKNHETGLLITDAGTLQKLCDDSRKRLDYVQLTEFQIDQLCSTADSMAALRKWNKADERDSDIGLSNILGRLCTPSVGNRNIVINESAQYFIKVSGVSDRPILPKDRSPRNEPHLELAFAKPPANLRLGDCLLEIAVGGGCFLSYYACASPVFEKTLAERKSDPDIDRWPYYVFANNLSLHYGERWFEKPIYCNDLVHKFKSLFPNCAVTSAGKDNLMAPMQQGHSYFRVTKEFGEFVRREIDVYIF